MYGLSHLWVKLEFDSNSFAANVAKPICIVKGSPLSFVN